jgi:hypothetical protein
MYVRMEHKRVTLLLSNFLWTFMKNTHDVRQQYKLHKTIQ